MKKFKSRVFFISRKIPYANQMLSLDDFAPARLLLLDMRYCIVLYCSIIPVGTNAGHDGIDYMGPVRITVFDLDCIYETEGLNQGWAFEPFLLLKPFTIMPWTFCMTCLVRRNSYREEMGSVSGSGSMQSFNIGIKARGKEIGTSCRILVSNFKPLLV